MSPANFFAEIHKRIGWIPQWGISFGIFVLLALAALILHRIIYSVLNRVARDSSLFQRSFITRTRGIARGALLVLALGLTAMLAPLSVPQARAVGHFVQVGIIILIGWAAIIAAHIATVVYMRRQATIGLQCGCAQACDAGEDPRARDDDAHRDSHLRCRFDDV